MNGYVEPDGPGRWRINLEAIPTRAALALQTPGTIYLSGSLGGTSSRLRPAFAGFGVGRRVGLRRPSPLPRRRFRRCAEISQSWPTPKPKETSGSSRPARSCASCTLGSNRSRRIIPGLALNARIVLSPLISSLDISDATIEAPASSARVTAHFGWPDSPALHGPFRDRKFQPHRSHRIARQPAGRLELAAGEFSFRRRLRCGRYRNRNSTASLSPAGRLGLVAASGPDQIRRTRQSAPAFSRSPRVVSPGLRPGPLHAGARYTHLRRAGNSTARFTSIRPPAVRRRVRLPRQRQCPASPQSDCGGQRSRLEYFPRMDLCGPGALRFKLARRHAAVGSATRRHHRVGNSNCPCHLAYSIPESTGAANPRSRRSEIRFAPHRRHRSRMPSARIWDRRFRSPAKTASVGNSRSTPISSPPPISTAG